MRKRTNKICLAMIMMLAFTSLSLGACSPATEEVNKVGQKNSNEIHENVEQPENQESKVEHLGYEESIEQAIATLEENLPDMQTAEKILPEYIEILDTCEGDIGNDDSLEQVVVLEYTDQNSVQNDEVLDTGSRIICVFEDAGNEKYQCVETNNSLILNRKLETVSEDTYAGMEIKDGLLKISTFAMEEKVKESRSWYVPGGDWDSNLGLILIIENGELISFYSMSD